MSPEPFWWAGFLQELAKQILQGLAIFVAGVGAAVVSFKLLSRQWEQTKLSSELTIDLMQRFWARLDVLARRLGIVLSSELKSKSTVEKQDAFYTLLDFRVTLKRFYEEASGWIPGIDPHREQQTATKQDAIYEATLRLLSARELSVLVEEMTTDRSVSLSYHKVIAQTENEGGSLKEAYGRFIEWSAKDNGKAAGDLGALCRDYASSLKRVIKLALPIY
jgi:hypothetical protein